MESHNSLAEGVGPHEDDSPSDGLPDQRLNPFDATVQSFEADPQALASLGHWIPNAEHAGILDIGDEAHIYHGSHTPDHATRPGAIEQTATPYHLGNLADQPGFEMRAEHASPHNQIDASLMAGLLPWDDSLRFDPADVMLSDVLESRPPSDEQSLPSRQP